EASRFIDSGALQKYLDLPMLPLAEFAGKPAAWLQKRGSLTHQALMDREAVRTAVEGFPRLVLEKKGTIPFKSRGGNVRRVAYDEVDLALKPLTLEAGEQVSLRDLHGIEKAVAFRVTPGEGDGTVGQI